MLDFCNFLGFEAVVIIKQDCLPVNIRQAAYGVQQNNGFISVDGILLRRAARVRSHIVRKFLRTVAIGALAHHIAAYIHGNAGDPGFFTGFGSE